MLAAFLLAVIRINRLDKLPLRIRPLLARPGIYSKDGGKALSRRNHDVMHFKRYDRSVHCINNTSYSEPSPAPVITFVRIPDALNNAITTAHQHGAHAEALVLPPEP